MGQTSQDPLDLIEFAVRWFRPPFTHSSMRILTTLRFLFLILALSQSVIASAKIGTTTDPFLDAQDAFRKGQSARVDAALSKHKGHPLLPYVEYYQLRLRIEQASAEDINAFMQRNAGDYLADALRSDLLRLYVRKGRWEAFQAEWTKLIQPDLELRCLALEARRQRPDATLKDDARELWRTPQELPDGCEQFYHAAFSLRLLPEKLVWERARLQIEAGKTALAREAVQLLSKPNHIDNKTWAAISTHPANYLGSLRGESRLSEHAQDVAALAVLRLARQVPEDAATELRRLQLRLSDETRADLWAAVAMQAAFSHHPKALEWYALGEGATLSDEEHRWLVRAALRAGDLKRAKLAIEAMPKALAEEGAWVYWHARALAAEGKQEAAQMQYGEIAGQPNFYGLLASEELGRKLVLPPRARAVSEEEVKQVGEIGAIRRALALFKLDLRTEAIREWNWVLKGMTDRQLLAAAELAKRQHIFDRAINTADKTQVEHDYTLRYLAPYDDTIRPASRKAAIDEAWVYGLMRQESRFITAARSSVGAQGLMQLMPATARWVARKIGMADFHPSRVNEIETNVALGTSYLRLVYESLDRSPVLASAAYNAGPGRARKWRDPQRALEGAIYAESIPFAETRDYVKKVMANAVIYNAVLNGKADSLKARIGIIRPGTGVIPEAEELP